MPVRNLDVANKNLLCDVLTHVLRFAEEINAQWGRWGRRIISAGAQERPFETIIDQVASSFYNESPTSPLGMLLQKVEILQTYGALSKEQQVAIVDALRQRLLKTRGREWENPSAVLPVSSDVSPTAEELVNPIEVIKDFLIDFFRVRESVINHYVQFWLRETFSLRHDVDLKYRLEKIVRALNYAFYGVNLISHTTLRTQNSREVALFSFLKIVQGCLEDLPLEVEKEVLLEKTRGEGEKSSHASALFIEAQQNDDILLRKKALGLYYALRFCNFLEIRVPGEHKHQAGQQPTSPDDRDVQVSALRPLEYTYFQARLFGVISGIKGLNLVFRGGILPHSDIGRTFLIHGPPGSGKTLFALHLLADMAYRGRIAFYFSFEESFQTIQDRLITFGLTDPSKYRIELAPDIQWTDDGKISPDTIESLRRTIGGTLNNALSTRGLLMIFAHEWKQLPLPEILDRLAAIIDATKDPRRNWRALAIDSIDALTFHLEREGVPPLRHDGHSSPREPYRATLDTVAQRRFVLDLVEKIEKLKFWGLLIGEEGGGSLPSLRYIAGTVIALGTSENHQTRWIEIQKSRPQGYHTGRHLFRISDGKGVKVYPSLSAFQFMLRRRGRLAINPDHQIPIPDELRKLIDDSAHLHERTSTLLWGPPRVGKTKWLLSLLTAPAHRATNIHPVRNVLVVTFRTPEVRYERKMEEDLRKRWHGIPSARIRWYSPGNNLKGEQILWELRETIVQSRRSGIPLERVAFDEIEAVPYTVPHVQENPTFWLTVRDLLESEGITTFFAATTDEDDHERTCQQFKDWVDLSFQIAKK